MNYSPDQRVLEIPRGVERINRKQFELRRSASMSSRSGTKKYKPELQRSVCSEVVIYFTTLEQWPIRNSGNRIELRQPITNCARDGFSTGRNVQRMILQRQKEIFDTFYDFLTSPRKLRFGCSHPVTSSCKASSKQLWVSCFAVRRILRAMTRIRCVMIGQYKNSQRFAL